MTRAIRIDNQTFKNMKEAASFLEVPFTELSVLLGHRNAVANINGFEVERLGDKPKRKHSPIICINTNEKYKDINTLTKYFGVSNGYISRQLNLYGKFEHKGKTYKRLNEKTETKYDIPDEIVVNEVVVPIISNETIVSPEIKDTQVTEPTVKEILKNIVIDFINKDSLSEAKAVMSALEKINCA